MLTESKTKRRWIVSVLEAAAEAPKSRAPAADRSAGQMPMQRGQKGIALRLKPVVRPLSDTAR